MDAVSFSERDRFHADRNIRLYPFIKVFYKRVFLPLSAVYFMAVANFSLAEIGMLGSLFFFINFIADVPAGMFADKSGRVNSIKVGAVLNIFATLLYALVQTKFAIALGVVLEALGYAFLSGAGEALIHDSLIVKDKLRNYTKVLSRAQSISLVINAVLLAVIPMTYAIDKRLPFLIGTLAYTALLILAMFMKDMPIHKKKIVNFSSIKPILRSKGVVGFALSFGLIGALYTAPSDMINLSFTQLGVSPQYLGWAYSGASIFAALFGLVFHHIKRLPLKLALILDASVVQIVFLGVFLGSLPLLVVGFLLSMAFFRYRRIYYQEKILQKFPDQPKAATISLLSNFEGIQQIWLPAMIGFTVAGYGLKNGFGVLLLFSVIASAYFVVVASRFFGYGKHPVS